MQSAIFFAWSVCIKVLTYVLIIYMYWYTEYLKWFNVQEFETTNNRKFGNFFIIYRGHYSNHTYSILLPMLM